ncbi:T-complex-associated testis-expressed protein 1 [Phlyctochytrium planicorne]|nr:T-complex-associated testis-expressed protein 1 [Phlyctochytrium planicorne]
MADDTADVGLGSTATISTTVPNHAQRRQSIIAPSTIADNTTVVGTTNVLQAQPQTPGGVRSQLSLVEGSDPNLSGLSMKERRMAQRRCIAEDPEWNLALVEKLSDLCVKVIVANFEEKSILNGLPNKYRERVLESISVTLPLSIAAPLIPDESYWKRRSLANFKNCDIRKHGDLWKRLFFELHIQTLAESFVPKNLAGLEELEKFEKELKLAASFVEKLHMRQMKPALPAEGTIIKATDPPPDHVDVNIFFTQLTNLKTLQLYYGILDCGMNFKWTDFGMTMNDCGFLAAALKANRTLKSLTIQMSGIDDDKVRVLSSVLLENKTLERLDLSHNKIGDAGARGLSKLLTSADTVLTYLNLGNNKIGRAGAHALGKALQQNQVLEEIVVRMNKFGDHGAAAFMAGLARGVMANSKLKSLDISSNGLGADSVSILCALLKRNGKNLVSIDLSCNKLGNFGSLPGGGPVQALAPAAGTNNAGNGRPGSGGKGSDADLAGKMLFEAISHNKYVTHLDIRVTDLSQDYMVAIKGIVTENSQ